MGKLFGYLSKKLAGWPATVLSAGLVMAGAFLVFVGLSGASPLFKAAVLAWVVLP